MQTDLQTCNSQTTVHARLSQCQKYQFQHLLGTFKNVETGCLQAECVVYGLLFSHHDRNIKRVNGNTISVTSIRLSNIPSLLQKVNMLFIFVTKRC